MGEYQLELPDKNMSDEMPPAFPKPTSEGGHPIEELEYFAMLINTVWVLAATDIRMYNIVENAMSRYEAAQASGLVVSHFLLVQVARRNSGKRSSLWFLTWRL